MHRRHFILATAALAALGRIPATANAAAPPAVAVYKDPYCGCCGAWVDHLRLAGFPVTALDRDDMERVKAELGVPPALASCHTALVDGYLLEGHVPAGAVERLLAERPDALGLAVPGMPVGSPGMEVPGMAPETYDVVLFGRGAPLLFARYRGGTRLPD